MLLSGLFNLFIGLIVPPCNKELLLIFFDRFDEDGNHYVDRYEAETHLDKYDINHDKHVTQQEAMETIGIVDPVLKGYERELFEFMDITHSGDVTLKDMEKIIDAVDENNDGYKSRHEVERFLDKYC